VQSNDSKGHRQRGQYYEELAARGNRQERRPCKKSGVSLREEEDEDITGLCRDVTSKCDFSSPSVPAAAISPGSSSQSSVDSETLDHLLSADTVISCTDS